MYGPVENVTVRHGGGGSNHPFSSSECGQDGEELCDALVIFARQQDCMQACAGTPRACSGFSAQEEMTQHKECV